MTTYNRATIKAVREYVFNKFGDEETDGRTAFKECIKAYKKANGIMDTRTAIYQYAAEGNIVAHVDDKRLALMDILNEDPDYAGMFTDEQVEHQYNWLIARDLSTCYKNDDI